MRIRARYSDRVCAFGHAEAGVRGHARGAGDAEAGVWGHARGLGTLKRGVTYVVAAAIAGKARSSASSQSPMGSMPAPAQALWSSTL